MAPFILTCVTFCFCVYLHYATVTNQTTVTTCITYFHRLKVVKYMDSVIMFVTQPAFKIIFEDFKTSGSMNSVSIKRP